MTEITRSFDQPRLASVFGPFNLAPDLACCSFDHTLRCEVSSPVLSARSMPDPQSGYMCTR